MGDTLELGDGRWRLVVAPLGGSLLACDYDGLPVLEPIEQPAPLGGGTWRGCYLPLLPWSTRVENARFSFGGETVRLAPNVEGSAHAMHGHGWQRAWQLIERSRTHCELAFDHDASPDWPWPYRGRQTIAIHGDALRITLGIENLGAAPMPCGLGFHPFLPADGGTRLRFEAAEVWDGRADAFPRKRVPVPAALDFHDGPRVAQRRGTDHCFDGWADRATVNGDETSRAWLLEGSGDTRCVVVYIPADGGYFCVEPVTHAVNALNLPPDAGSGLWVLGAREAREVTMTIRPLPDGESQATSFNEGA